MTDSRLSHPQASRAVLVGVHEYEHLDPLPAVERNLTGLKDALTDPNIWGLPPEHVTRIPQPTDASDLLDAVIDAGAQATDTLVIYYAGHGLSDEDSDELYLALPRSRSLRPDTAFRYELLRRHLAKVAAARVVIILDCCWSGRVLLGAMDAGDALADLAAVPGRCVLTASAATQIAQAPPGETYTAFTGVLLELLTHGVPHCPELLDMQTLYLQARANLRSQSRPLPELGSRGSPSLICIAKNVSAQRTPSPPEAPPPAPPVTPVTPSSHKRAGVPARMPALVHDCLLRPPSPRRLYVAQPNLPESSQLQKARKTHHLEHAEELIAVWQWSKLADLFSSTPSSLAFTSRGVRIAQGSLRLDIPYSEFHHYTFRLNYWANGGRLGPATYMLVIEGPNAWSSPGMDSPDPEYVVADLNSIKELGGG